MGEPGRVRSTAGATAGESDPVRGTDPMPADPLDRPARESRSVAEEFLDDLMPPELDWRRLVRRHPIPSLLAAAAAGYWLGRSRKGRIVADALAGLVATGVVSRFADLDGLDVLDGLGAEVDDHAEGFI